jgi:hypothetical protein
MLGHLAGDATALLEACCSVAQGAVWDSNIGSIAVNKTVWRNRIEACKAMEPAAVAEWTLRSICFALATAYRHTVLR